MSEDIQISEDFAKPALERIQKAVKGNGIRAENVSIKSFEGAVLNYLAATEIRCDAKLSEKTIAGRAGGQTISQNRQEAHKEAQKFISNILKDNAAREQITNLIKKKPNNGFGLDNETLKLSSLNREFTSHEACQPCSGKGSALCAQCKGKGFEPCTNCNAQGFEKCHECNGNRQMRGPNGDMQTCNLCQGLGKTSCSFCKENRQVQCRLCNTKGEIQCKSCGGQGAQSHIVTAEISALCSYDYDSETLPDKAIAVINDLGAELANYAQIIPVQKENEQGSDETLRLFYNVQIPQGDVDCSLKEKTIRAYLFGKEGEIRDIPDFLDDIISPGASSLSQAASAQGNVIDNIKKAVRYKTLKQAVTFASRYSTKKACKALMHYNPLGLSVGMTKQIIENANSALNHVTKQQRMIATAAGAGGVAILAALYFLSPLRSIIAQNIANPSFHLPVDIMMIGLCAFAGYAIWQTISSNARKQALNTIMAR